MGGGKSHSWRDNIKKAAALKYGDANKNLNLIAKGQGKLAEQIISVAAEHNVAIKEDPDLVEALSKLDLYQEIPEELYRVAAELLSEIFLLNQRIQ